jgi:hypothetical protein
MSDILTLNSSLVQEVAQLKVAVARGKVLGEPLEQMKAHLDDEEQKFSIELNQRLIKFRTSFP